MMCENQKTNFHKLMTEMLNYTVKHEGQNIGRYNVPTPNLYTAKTLIPKVWP